MPIPPHGAGDEDGYQFTKKLSFCRELYECPGLQRKVMFVNLPTTQGDRMEVNSPKLSFPKNGIKYRDMHRKILFGN